MDNQNHCMNIKQARLIVNAHKHYLLIILQQRVCMFILNNMKTTTKSIKKYKKIKRERERMLKCAASNYLIEFVIQ